MSTSTSIGDDSTNRTEVLLNALQKFVVYETLTVSGVFGFSFLLRKIFFIIVLLSAEKELLHSWIESDRVDKSSDPHKQNFRHINAVHK